MDPIIVPAIITENQEELDEMINHVEKNAKRIMLDVMDGEFVPNSYLTFDFKITATSDLEYDAHLMVNRPLEWIEKNGNKVNIVVMHVETLKDIREAMNFARGKDLGVILALNPETELDVVLPFLNDLDGILILTVNPGKYGAPFVPETLSKIKRLRRINSEIPIEVDGAINPENIMLAKDAEATIFASGGYIMKSDDPKKAIKKLQDVVKR